MDYLNNFHNCQIINSLTLSKLFRNRFARYFPETGFSVGLFSMFSFNGPNRLFVNPDGRKKYSTIFADIPPFFFYGLLIYASWFIIDQRGLFFPLNMILNLFNKVSNVPEKSVEFGFWLIIFLPC